MAIRPVQWAVRYGARATLRAMRGLPGRTCPCRRVRPAHDDKPRIPAWPCRKIPAQRPFDDKSAGLARVCQLLQDLVARREEISAARIARPRRTTRVHRPPHRRPKPRTAKVGRKYYCGRLESCMPAVHNAARSWRRGGKPGAGNHRRQLLCMPRIGSPQGPSGGKEGSRGLAPPVIAKRGPCTRRTSLFFSALGIGIESKDL
jgi:hypothetical protein